MTVLMDLQSLPPAARELLQSDAAALRQRWEACQDAAVLEAAIQQYKEALAVVLHECRRLGASEGVPFERPGRLGGLGCCGMPLWLPTMRSGHRGLAAAAAPPPPGGSWRPPKPSCSPALATLARAGVDPLGGDDSTSGGGAEEAVEGQEGIEGVDWRYGSVDELDPTEWQVGGVGASVFCIEVIS